MIRDAVAQPQVRFGFGGDVRSLLQPDSYVLVRANEAFTADIRGVAHFAHEIGQTLAEVAFIQIQRVVSYHFSLPDEGFEEYHGFLQVACFTS